MTYFEIIIISISLAMDAFAVSISKGLTLKKFQISKALLAGIFFGIFQGVMPLIGYLVGSSFATYVTSFAHWIAFAILAFVGANMIKESFGEEEVDGDFSFKTMLMLAIATSIDALSVGVSFSMQEICTHILIIVLIIGVITFIISGLGVLIGSSFGSKYKKPAEIAGGVILILIGLKILLEGLGVLNF